tara:strand:- start:1242 stop:1484 length:243 start_codon:yes stop_codon:yes gene_type:complete
MTTKQPTLAQLEAASKAQLKAESALTKVELKYSPEATQAQFDAARLRVKKADAKYWDMVERVTSENKEYVEIERNGHYEC